MAKEPTFPVTPFDFYANNGLSPDHHAIFNEEPSLTRQEFAEECDINAIMARYEKTGVISHVNQREPLYIDYTALPTDLAGTLAALQLGEEAFMTLPASVRKEFDNNAINFVEFASDPENLDQMREWGLAPPVQPPAEPVAVRVIADPVAPADAPAPAPAPK